MRSPFVFDWVAAHASDRPEAPCVGTPTGWLSYGAVAARIDAFAASLAAHGVAQGSMVLVRVNNCAAVVVASLAAQRLGGVSVELPADLEPSLLEAIAAQTDARHLVLAGRDLRRWSPLIAKGRFRRVWLVQQAPPTEEQLALLSSQPHAWLTEEAAYASDASGVPAPAPTPEPVRVLDAPALLVYTSGSTGAPRGVVQTHRNIAANTSAICEYLGLTSEDRVLSILPLFYCYGKSLLQTHLFSGGSVLFDHRFVYPRLVLEAMREQRCTGFSGVPLTFELLRRQVDVRELASDSLRYVTQAGGAMHPETIAWARAAFSPAQLFVMYGQTEATARLSYLPPERARDKAGSIGCGLSNVELRVVGADGAPVGAGVIGEIVARGESVTPGYFGAPVETAQIIRDGWLYTGDLGYRDDEGFIFITGRAKEFLKLGGHRVSAIELEQAVAASPGVLEVAIIGAPDDLGGEAPVAFVVPRDAALSDAALKRELRERLPLFKVPREIVFVDALPRGASGKVAKAELRRRWEELRS